MAPHAEAWIASSLALLAMTVLDDLPSIASAGLTKPTHQAADFA
jgi:hypothetical protein